MHKLLIQFTSGGRKVSAYALALAIPIFATLILCNCAEDQTKSQNSHTGFTSEGRFAEGKLKKDTAKANEQSVSIQPNQGKTASKSSVTYTKDELLGKFNAEKHAGFAAIKAPYTTKPGMWLRSEVADAFVEMWKAAHADGIDLAIISSTRSFEHQAGIWGRKWAALKTKSMSDAEKAKNIMLYSAMPSCSRHHWGADVDLNSLENQHFEAGGKGQKTYDWLVANGSRFGFCQVYSARSTGRNIGYEEEKWHWSYMPTAKLMLEAYLQQVSYADIRGFRRV